MARLKGILGVDLEPLYDQIVLPSGGTNGERNFFATPRGNVDPSLTSYTKSLVDTNMAQTYRLSKPEEFDVLGVALIPEFDTAIADTKKVYNKSYFEIRGTGNSVQFRCPTRTITQGCGLTRTDASASGNGLPQPQAIVAFPLEHAIEIKEGEQFSAHLIFVENQTFSADVRIMCVLWGLHKKGVGKN